MKSLFVRMRLVHWIAIALLVINIVVFTENLISQIIQSILVLAVLIHDFDEKKWGVDTLKALTKHMHNFINKDLTQPCNVDFKLNSEIKDIVFVIEEFKENIRSAVQDVKNISDKNQQKSHAIKEMSNKINMLSNQTDETRTKST